MDRKTDRRAAGFLAELRRDLWALNREIGGSLALVDAIDELAQIGQAQAIDAGWSAQQ